MKMKDGLHSGTVLPLAINDLVGEIVTATYGNERDSHFKIVGELKWNDKDGEGQVFISDNIKVKFDYSDLFNINIRREYGFSNGSIAKINLIF